MAGVWRDERFVQHERGVLEARVEVAVRPCVGRLAHRQTALLVLSEVRLGPLEFRDFGLWRILWPRLHPDVAVGARVRPTRTQRVERIDDERQRLKINANLFDRCRGGEFVDRGHGENRFALIERLIGEPPFAPLAGFDHRAVVGEGIGRSGNVVCRQHRFDAGHGERLARLDAPDTRVRQRAEQQFAEQHAGGAIVLGVLRFPRDLRMEIGGDVVLADQPVLSPVLRRG